MDLQRILARCYNLLFLATYKHQYLTIQTRKKQTVVKSKLKKESKEKGITSHCYSGWSLLNKIIKIIRGKLIIKYIVRLREREPKAFKFNKNASFLLLMPFIIQAMLVNFRIRSRTFFSWSLCSLVFFQPSAENERKHHSPYDGIQINYCIKDLYVGNKPLEEIT